MPEDTMELLREAKEMARDVSRDLRCSAMPYCSAEIAERLADTVVKLIEIIEKQGASPNV